MSVVHIAQAREGDPADPRESLREAQQQLAAAKAALEMHKTAIARAEDMVEQAREKLVAAEAGVAAAREKHARLIADAAASGSPSPSSERVRSARAVLQECRDEIETSEMAVAALREAFPPFLEAAKLADIAIIAARNGYLAPKVDELLGQARRARDDFFRLGQIIKILTADDERIPEPEPGSEPAVWTRFLRLSEEARAPMFAASAAFEELRAATQHRGGFDAWGAWRKKLLTDANAQPPESAS